MTIRTRFAPSPTGYLHIGGARTALFNYLFARHNGGEFLLRIEDTDKARNTPEAVQAIYGGLDWLGLDHDGEVVLQSERESRHVEVAMELLNSQDAYYDNGAIRIRGTSDVQTIEDLVQGTVTWPQKIDDFVILRSDGTPTYMLAVVVDDHDMGITHVIRGDDHLNNAFRQNVIYRAMGWDIPVYAHIPLIHDTDGKKLSKRTGAAAVEDYRDDMGILPAAMLNYLAKLGWGHGNDEIFSLDQAIEWFDIKDVGRGPARLDGKKLANINGQYIRNMDDSDLFKIAKEQLDRTGFTYTDEILRGAIPLLKERSANIHELVHGTFFLWKDVIDIADNAKPLLDADILNAVLCFIDANEWDKDIIEGAIKTYASTHELKLGKVAGAIRSALTGSKISPPIFETMMLLGRDRVIKRIKESLNV